MPPCYDPDDDGCVGKGFKSSLFLVPPSTAPGSPDAKSKDQLCGQHFLAMMRDLGKDLKGRFGKRKHAIIRDRAPHHVSDASTAALSPLNLPIVEGFPA